MSTAYKVLKMIEFELGPSAGNYYLPGGKCGKFGWYRYRKIKTCTHAKFRKYAQNIG